MILSSAEIARYLQAGDVQGEEDSLYITPRLDLAALRTAVSASVDLRLGTWFATTKLSRHAALDVYAKDDQQPSEHSLATRHYVPFGSKFILHPRSFVLAGTLEWIRMPRTLCGYVTGKSSWGRRGLVIETAPGVHPGFTGCLTLELANVGEIPIVLQPGIRICQLFLHKLEGKVVDAVDGSFSGLRQPILGKIFADTFAQKLAKRH